MNELPNNGKPGRPFLVDGLFQDGEMLKAINLAARYETLKLKGAPALIDGDRELWKADMVQNMLERSLQKRL